jgi:hypothetical protein
MAMIPGCDIYPGRTKDVKKFRIRITEVDEHGTEVADVRDGQRYLCPAALARIEGFMERGARPPTEAKVDEDPGSPAAVGAGFVDDES